MATAAEETRAQRLLCWHESTPRWQTDPHAQRWTRSDGSNKAREASRQTTLADFIVHPAQNNTRGNNSAADSDPEDMVTRSTRRARDGLSGKASGSTSSSFHSSEHILPWQTYLTTRTSLYMQQKNKICHYFEISLPSYKHVEPAFISKLFCFVLSSSNQYTRLQINIHTNECNCDT